MVNEEQFRSLLQRMEDETLDFKAQGYNITDEDSRLSFVKDVLSMANTPRDTTSFIVLGVKKYADGSYDLPGVEMHPDEADLQSQFTTRTSPIPDSTVVFWRTIGTPSPRSGRLLLGEHMGKDIFRPLSELESLVGIQDQRLNEGPGLLATRFPDGFDGQAALCR